MRVRNFCRRAAIHTRDFSSSESTTACRGGCMVVPPVAASCNLKNILMNLYEHLIIIDNRQCDGRLRINPPIPDLWSAGLSGINSTKVLRRQGWPVGKFDCSIRSLKNNIPFLYGGKFGKRKKVWYIGEFCCVAEGQLQPVHI